MRPAAIQMRQSTAAQHRSSELHAALAIDTSVDRWSVFRRMLADESIGPVWAKAFRDESLTDEEIIQVRSVVQQLAYSQVGTLATWRATGREAQFESLSEAVALELRGSDTLRRAWELIVEELAVFGLRDFASDVSARLALDPATSPSALRWLRSLASDGNQ